MDRDIILNEALNRGLIKVPPLGCDEHMSIVADTHVHIYPMHDVSLLLRTAYRHLTEAVGSMPDDPPAVVLFLTEGKGCDVFSDLSSKAGLEDESDLVVKATPDPEVLKIETPGATVWLTAGRQIVTAERLEVLALACKDMIDDGLPIREVIQQVYHAGGLPVVPWAPGKWWFKRGRVLRELLKEKGGDWLRPADSTLRPRGYPWPGLMTAAERSGSPVLAGSDPLPVAGEEDTAGRYGVYWPAALDQNAPASCLRKLLLDPGVPVRRIGRRGSMLKVGRRMLAHRNAKKQSGTP